MSSHQRKGPGTAANSTEAQRFSTGAEFSSIVREIIAVLTVGAMMATMFWTSVFGMTGQFGPGPEITVNERLAAAGGADGR